MVLSVIIPTLNEEERIAALLSLLRSTDPTLELIVADGGSTDGTLDQARLLARVLSSPQGRARQMNTGARAARGQVLWFLHADCRPHPESPEAIRRALRDPRVVAGAFAYSLDAPGAIYRLSEALSNRKNRLLHLLYGDMGIFVRAEVFRGIGGYADLPLMEDMDLCRRLKRSGRVVILPQTMTTSARRWRSEGAVRNIVRNWALQIAWFAGVSPRVLARHYSFTAGGLAQDSQHRYESEES